MPHGWGNPAVLVALFLAAGVVDDLRSRKIHNPLVLILLTASLLGLIFLPGLSYVTAAQSFGLALVFSLVLFVVKVWGGGDAKLFLAVSPLLLPSDLPMFLLYSFVWGAALGLTMAILNGRLLSMISNLRFVFIHRTGVPERQLTKVPFSVALLFGHLSVVMLKQRGLL